MHQRAPRLLEDIRNAADFVKAVTDGDGNFTLNEALVAQAAACASNLSVTIGAPLADYAAQQQQSRGLGQQAADGCAQDWNAVHACIGSFADEHSTL